MEETLEKSREAAQTAQEKPRAPKKPKGKKRAPVVPSATLAQIQDLLGSIVSVEGGTTLEDACCMAAERGTLYLVGSDGALAAVMMTPEAYEACRLGHEAE